MYKMNGLLLFTLLASLFSCSNSETVAEPQSDKEQTYQLVNPNATTETKQLFNMLTELYGKKIISGVVANVDWNYRDAENVYKWTGRWPAINVFDFMNIHASKDVNPKGWLDYSDDTCVREWHEGGGIVGCMWHWQVMCNDGVNRTCSPGTNPNETSFDPSQVYVDGTAENKVAVQQLDQVCGYLKKMQKQGIPVIWRPFHEAAGNTYEFEGGKAWFWWGAKGPEVYKQLWRWMYDYMVTKQGLNNLIWVWNSQMGDGVWYPGDDVVDIVGRDNYAALQYPLMKEFKQLTAEYPTKMITLAECGNGDEVKMSLLSRIWGQGSRWSWFMTWYDYDYNNGNSEEHKFADEAWWKDAFAQPYVVTREQIKELLK